MWLQRGELFYLFIFMRLYLPVYGIVGVCRIKVFVSVWGIRDEGG